MDVYPHTLPNSKKNIIQESVSGPSGTDKSNTRRSTRYCLQMLELFLNRQVCYVLDVQLVQLYTERYSVYVHVFLFAPVRPTKI